MVFCAVSDTVPPVPSLFISFPNWSEKLSVSWDWQSWVTRLVLTNQTWLNCKTSWIQNEFENRNFRTTYPSVRSYLKGKLDMNIVSLSKILLSRFKEPSSIALLAPLSNWRQAVNVSAQEYIMRLMLLHQKKFFLVKSCSYSEKLIQNHFTDVVLTGLQNENIGNKDVSNFKIK